MIFALVFVVSAILVALWLLGYISWLVALVPIGVVVAVLIGYSMRRGSGSGPP